MLTKITHENHPVKRDLAGLCHRRLPPGEKEDRALNRFLGIFGLTLPGWGIHHQNWKTQKSQAEKNC